MRKTSLLIGAIKSAIVAVATAIVTVLTATTWASTAPTIAKLAFALTESALLFAADVAALAKALDRATVGTLTRAFTARGSSGTLTVFALSLANLLVSGLLCQHAGFVVRAVHVLKNFSDLIQGLTGVRMAQFAEPQTVGLVVGTREKVDYQLLAEVAMIAFWQVIP